MVMSRSSRSGMSHNKTPLMRYDSQTLGNMYFNTIKTPLIEEAKYTTLQEGKGWNNTDLVNPDGGGGEC